MIYREMDERLTDRIIEAIYGFYCMKTGKQYNQDEAYEEYIMRKLTYDLSFPLLKNVTEALKAEIYENMEFKPKNRGTEEAISEICRFVESFEKHNSENCLKNNPYTSLSCYMIDYCQELRKKA